MQWFYDKFKDGGAGDDFSFVAWQPADVPVCEMARAIDNGGSVAQQARLAAVRLLWPHA